MGITLDRFIEFLAHLVYGLVYLLVKFLILRLLPSHRVMDYSYELISDALGLNVSSDTLQSVPARAPLRKVVSKPLYLILRAVRRGVCDVKDKLNRMLSPLDFVDRIIETVVDCLGLIVACVNYRVVQELNHLAYIT